MSPEIWASRRLLKVYSEKVEPAPTILKNSRVFSQLFKDNYVPGSSKTSRVRAGKLLPEKTYNFLPETSNIFSLLRLKLLMAVTEWLANLISYRSPKEAKQSMSRRSLMLKSLAEPKLGKLLWLQMELIFSALEMASIFRAGNEFSWKLVNFGRSRVRFSRLL